MFRSIDLAIRHLFPGYFAMVMATGIISIAAFLLDMRAIATGLFLVNLMAYAVLCLMTAARVVLHTDRVSHDLASFHRGPGFLTSVAATCIVGSQVFLLLKSPATGLVLWLFGLALWLGTMYPLFIAAITSPQKPDTPHALHGGWLIPVVATQAIAVLGTLLAPEFSGWTPALLFVSLSMFLLGSMLYVIIITLIFRRLVFSMMTSGDFTPPYWIDLGAIAISTLAGSTLVLAAPSWRFLQQVLPFVLGLTVLFWVTATWWIPLLTALEVWRHGTKRYPFRYDPLYWDIVFPLGMYTTCTLQLARATGLPFEPVARCFIYVALGVWLVVCFGLIKRIAHSLYYGRAPHRASYHRSQRHRPGT